MRRCSRPTGRRQYDAHRRALQRRDSDQSHLPNFGAAQARSRPTSVMVRGASSAAAPAARWSAEAAPSRRRDAARATRHDRADEMQYSDRGFIITRRRAFPWGRGAVRPRQRRRLVRRSPTSIAALRSVFRAIPEPRAHQPADVHRLLRCRGEVIAYVTGNQPARTWRSSRSGR